VKPERLLGKRLKLIIKVNSENLHCSNMDRTGIFRVFCVASRVAYVDASITKTDLKDKV
jgi:hypothetical protein